MASATSVTIPAAKYSSPSFHTGDLVECTAHIVGVGASPTFGKVYTVGIADNYRAQVQLREFPGYIWKSDFFKLHTAYPQMSGAPTTTPNDVCADPAKPYPDPEAEREKSAEEKLREYRKSVRNMIGL